MFKNIMFVILAVVLITSCNTRQFEDVTDTSASIVIPGVSVLPPKGNNWKVVSKSEADISFVRRGSQPDATYAATVMQLKLPETESKEQFANEMREKLQSETENERFKFIKNEGQLSVEQETICWRYHMISEDRTARTDSGKKSMLLEMVGYICQHPKAKKKGINIQYSHRYFSGDQDLEIKAKADEFFNHVTFTDSNSVSDALPTNAEAKRHYMNGLSYLKNGQFDNAIPELDQAIESDPQFALAYNDRGYAYLHRQGYDLAIADFSKALKLKKHPHAYHNRGIAYRHKGQYDDAISDQSKALELNPMKAEPYYERGVAYLQNRKNDKAIDDFEQAITLKPGYAQAFIYRGIAYQRKRQYDFAISDFSKAIKIDSKQDFVYYNRAISYFYKREYSRAWEDIHKAQRMGLNIPPRFITELRKASGREK